MPEGFLQNLMITFLCSFSGKATEDSITQAPVALKLSGVHTDTERKASLRP